MGKKDPLEGSNTRYPWFILLAILIVVFGKWLGARVCSDRSSYHPATSTADQHGPRAIGQIRRQSDEAALSVRSESTEITSEHDDSCLVRGVVVDENNRPVEAAIIHVLAGGMIESARTGRWDPIWQEAGVISDAIGAFTFEVDSNCPPKLAASTGEDMLWGECEFERNATSPVECVLVLEDAWPLRGVVVDAVGRPVAGAQVSAMQQWNMDQLRSEVDPRVGVPFNHLVVDIEAMWSRHSLTDSTGMFEIERVPEDDWAIVVEKNGYERGFAQLTADELLDGGEIRVVLHPTDCWTVRVLDTHGEPVDGAEVSVVPIVGRPTSATHKGKTDDSGSSVVCEVANTNSRISIIPQWHERKFLPNVEGEDPLMVTVEDRGKLTGAIHCPNTGDRNVISCRAVGKNCVAPDGSACQYSGYVSCASIESSFVIKHVIEGEMDVEIHCMDQVQERHAVVRSGESTDIGSMVFTIPERRLRATE